MSVNDDHQIKCAERFGQIETDIDHILKAIDRLILSINGRQKTNRAWILMLIPTILILTDMMIRYFGT